MSDKRYLGNIITQNPTAPAGPYQDSAASGVWSLAEALSYTKGGLWPTAGNSLLHGIYAGGLSGYATDIQFINITTLGNSSDFGDLFLGVSNQPAAASSSTRYLYAGGYDGSVRTNTIQYGAFSTGGTGLDFGNLTSGRDGVAGLSSSTRAIFGGGGTPTVVNVIEYVTIDTTGNATDFGDLTKTTDDARGVASTTRGVFMGDSTSGTIQYITIASTGNASDFGDMSDNVKYYQGGACSNNIRGIYAGGSNNSSFGINNIEYITIASTGNSTDFGDLLSADRYNDGVSSSTRAVFLGFAGTDQSEYVTIATTGNAVEFGDLAGNRIQVGAGTSNAHGGIAA